MEDSWLTAPFSADSQYLTSHISHLGMGPLCQFLGVPEPEEDFPHVNVTAELLQKLQQVKGLCHPCWARQYQGRHWPDIM